MCTNKALNQLAGGEGTPPLPYYYRRVFHSEIVLPILSVFSGVNLLTFHRHRAKMS